VSVGSLIHSVNDIYISFLRGFGHEGTRRRAHFSPTDGSWKDVTYLAMLDTEWVMRGFFRPAPKSLWDELFARHERERQELLRWEDNRANLKRSSSMETVRLNAGGSGAGPPKRSKFGPSEERTASSLPRVEKGKERLTSHSDTGSPPPPSDSEDGTDYFSDDEPSMQGADLASLLRKPAALPSSPPSSSSSSSSRSRSLSSASSSGSPGSSQWDLLETSSTRSSSAFESIHGSDVED
jgi:hypothetical protein